MLACNYHTNQASSGGYRIMSLQWCLRSSSLSFLRGAWGFMKRWKEILGSSRRGGHELDVGIPCPNNTEAKWVILGCFRNLEGKHLWQSQYLWLHLKQRILEVMQGEDFSLCFHYYSFRSLFMDGEGSREGLGILHVFGIPLDDSHTFILSCLHHVVMRWEEGFLAEFQSHCQPACRGCNYYTARGKVHFRV